MEDPLWNVGGPRKTLKENLKAQYNEETEKMNAKHNEGIGCLVEDIDRLVDEINHLITKNVCFETQINHFEKRESKMEESLAEYTHFVFGSYHRTRQPFKRENSALKSKKKIMFKMLVDWEVTDAMRTILKDCLIEFLKGYFYYTDEIIANYKLLRHSQEDF